MAEIKLPPNSDNVINKDQGSSSKERTPVSKHSTKTPKKTSKLGGIFKSEGNNVAKYILNDVIKPTVLDSLYDLGSGALGMIIYKDPNAFKRATLKRTRGSLGSLLSPTSYSSISRPRTREPFLTGKRDYTNKASVSLNVLDEVNIFDTYEDAYLVKNALQDICLNEHAVTISDFFRLVGEEPDYTFDNYGWTSVDAAYVTRSGDQYYIELPRPKQLR